MALRSPVDRYQAESQTVTQQRLLVLLYDRVLRDLDEAEIAIAANDRFITNKSLVHAQEIIAELESALDPSVWDAAKELSSLYLFLQGRLVRANLANDVRIVRECRSAIKPLRDAWAEAWQQMATQGVPSHPSAGGAVSGPAQPPSGNGERRRVMVDVSG